MPNFDNEMTVFRLNITFSFTKYRRDTLMYIL